MAEFEASGIRISDTERESALTALGEHMGTGRLDIDEYGDRSAKVATAKTRADLLELFEDLPQPHPTFAGQTPPTAPAAPVAPARQNAASLVAMRAMGALVPLAFLGALVAFIFLHALWFVFLVPVALTMVGSSIWGKGWNKERQYRASIEHREMAREMANEQREMVREQMRDARDQVRDQMRSAQRHIRDNRRDWNNQNREFRHELKQQVRNEVYRRMRDRRRG